MSTLVGVPVKNAGIWIERFLMYFKRLKGVSRAVFYYGLSSDDTLKELKEWAEKAPFPIEIYEDPPMRARSSAEIAPVYKELQDIMKEGDETHFLSIDADIMKIPKTLIRSLKKQKKDIIAPYVYIEGQKPRTFYDTDVFRYKGLRFHHFDPPKPKMTFELDSVGTCWLATREAFTETEIDNPYPDRIFCDNAREAGFKVWADPRLSIYHLNTKPFGLHQIPLEAILGKPPDNTAYIRSDDTVVDIGTMPSQYAEAFVWGRVPK